MTVFASDIVKVLPAAHPSLNQWHPPLHRRPPQFVVAHRDRDRDDSVANISASRRRWSRPSPSSPATPDSSSASASRRGAPRSARQSDDDYRTRHSCRARCCRAPRRRGVQVDLAPCRQVVFFSSTVSRELSEPEWWRSPRGIRQLTARGREDSIDNGANPRAMKLVTCRWIPRRHKQYPARPNRDGSRCVFPRHEERSITSARNNCTPGDCGPPAGTKVHQRGTESAAELPDCNAWGRPTCNTQKRKEKFNKKRRIIVFNRIVWPIRPLVNCYTFPYIHYRVLSKLRAAWIIAVSISPTPPPRGYIQLCPHLQKLIVAFRYAQFRAIINYNGGREKKITLSTVRDKLFSTLSTARGDYCYFFLFELEILFFLKLNQKIFLLLQILNDWFSIGNHFKEFSRK